MASICINPLRDDLGFGARVSGVSLDALRDEAVREQLRDLFEARGLIVFEAVEPSSRMQVAVSEVFGPLKDHPYPGQARVDQDTMPGVIDMRHDPATGGIVEIDGRQLSQWLPWHFDHCYNDELNRAGVLRAVDIPPEGGLTGFADGIELYRALSPALRERIQQVRVIYTLDMLYAHMRFGKPEGLREIRVQREVYQALDYARTQPRALHPAVWTRQSGEKVLHVSPWMAVGLEGREDPAGDDLLAAVCREIVQKANPYFHRWKTTDMLIWDNWRLLHCVSGHRPDEPRRMHRTTIKGDYGLGSFENGGVGDRVLAETTV
jgi:taurine dioxygenase